MILGLAIAALIVVGFICGWLWGTAVTERRHDCMPHDPDRCRERAVDSPHDRA